MALSAAHHKGHVRRPVASGATGRRSRGSQTSRSEADDHSRGQLEMVQPALAEAERGRRSRTRRRSVGRDVPGRKPRRAASTAATSAAVVSEASASMANDLSRTQRARTHQWAYHAAAGDPRRHVGPHRAHPVGWRRRRTAVRLMPRAERSCASTDLNRSSSFFPCAQDTVRWAKAGSRVTPARCARVVSCFFVGAIGKAFECRRREAWRGLDPPTHMTIFEAQEFFDLPRRLGMSSSPAQVTPGGGQGADPPGLGPGRGKRLTGPDATMELKCYSNSR